MEILLARISIKIEKLKIINRDSIDLLSEIEEKNNEIYVENRKGIILPKKQSKSYFDSKNICALFNDSQQPEGTYFNQRNIPRIFDINKGSEKKELYGTMKSYLTIIRSNKKQA